MVLKRTLLVGLDAACWEYLNPLIEAGKMPVLQGLMEKGSWGVMHTTMPAWTPAAWSSIATGKNPGKHGVYDMTWRKPSSYEFQPVTSQNRSGRPFWQLLNEAGLRVGLVNIPFLYPITPLDGFAVSGFGTPASAKNLIYPQEAVAELEQRFGPYEPVISAELIKNSTPADILRAEAEHQARQVDMALWLAQRYPVDVLAINLMLPDHANHKMPEMSLVEEALCRSDRDLGRLLDGFQPQHVLLVSDHGSSRLKGEFLLDAWLRDQGYYQPRRRTPREAAGALNWALVQWLQVKKGRSGMLEKLTRRVLKSFLLHAPSAFSNGLWARLEQDLPFVRDFVWFTDEPDFERTQVFPGSVHSGLLYLNLKGREPSGVVDEAEREQLLEELVTRLESLKDPHTGAPLFTKVYRASELYSGTRTDSAPDLIIDSFSSAWNIRLSSYTPVPEKMEHRYFVSSRVDYGWHSRDGIFVFAGENIEAGHDEGSAHVTDIPATLLYLCGVPVPEDYDGRVMLDVIRQDYREAHPVQHQPGETGETASYDSFYTPQEKEELANHLRALGYF